MSRQNEKNKGILLPSKQYNRSSKSDSVNMAGLIDRLNALSSSNTSTHSTHSTHSSHCKYGELSISIKQPPSFHDPFFRCSPITTEQDNCCDYTPMTTTTNAYAYNMVFGHDNKIQNELPYITDSPIPFPQIAENKHCNTPNYTPSTVTYNEVIDTSYPELCEYGNSDKLDQNMTKLSQSTSSCVDNMDDMDDTDDVLMVFKEINNKCYKEKKKHSHSGSHSKSKSKRKYKKKSKPVIKYGYSNGHQYNNKKKGHQYNGKNKNASLKPSKSNPFY